MAADTTILQGEVMEDPQSHPLDVEKLLTALLSSLLKEQREQNAQPEAEGQVTS